MSLGICLGRRFDRRLVAKPRARIPARITAQWAVQADLPREAVFQRDRFPRSA